MSEAEYLQRIDRYLKRVAVLPEQEFWGLLDDPWSAFWKVATRIEFVTHVYWYRREAGLWRKPDPSEGRSRGRFLVVAASMLDEAANDG
jgi:hypothetical protein